MSASCAVLLSLCCVSRRTVSRASSLVWSALLCARSVRRVCSRVTRCALCCVYICSWSVYLPGLSLVVAGLHPFLICISFWPVSSSLRLHLVLVCISPRSVSRRCWSASLPGLCIFLVCISSLRLHLVLICISISPCLYLVVASLSLRLYGGFACPTFLSTSNSGSLPVIVYLGCRVSLRCPCLPRISCPLVSFLSTSNLCAPVKIRASHENREMHKHTNTWSCSWPKSLSSSCVCVFVCSCGRVRVRRSCRPRMWITWSSCRVSCGFVDVLSPARCALRW